jgi:hypothetical protein
MSLHHLQGVSDRYSSCMTELFFLSEIVCVILTVTPQEVLKTIVTLNKVII